MVLVAILPCLQSQGLGQTFLRNGTFPSLLNLYYQHYYALIVNVLRLLAAESARPFNLRVRKHQLFISLL